jgi:hypothetical protein
MVQQKIRGKSGKMPKKSGKIRENVEKSGKIWKNPGKCQKNPEKSGKMWKNPEKIPGKRFDPTKN